MTQEEQILQNALINTYTHNMYFLSQYDEPLFNRLAMLSEAINQSLYEERYFLEFIKENGDFDIYDSHTKTFLYNKKPKQWNNKSVINTNMDASGSISLVNPKLYDIKCVDLSNEEIENKFFALHAIQTASTFNQFTSLLPLNLHDQKTKFKTFDKFLFIGALLARHIPKILHKTNSKHHFVCEANIEIFRLSLFVTDYSLLARDGKSVIFSIMDEDSQFLSKFKLFFYNYIQKNTLLKFYSTDRDVGHMFDLIFSFISGIDPFTFNFNSLLYGTLKESVKNIQHINTINFTKNNFFKEQFQNTPVLLIGAGPSLGKNIDWLQQHQNKFIIIAMASSLKRLQKHNIQPDIITSIDPQKFIAQTHFDIDHSLLNQSIKLIATNSHQSVIAKLSKNKESLFLYESMVSILQNNKPILGKSVGEASLMILLLLQFQNIYLLGTDLALNQTTGSTHDELHRSTTKHNINKTIETRSSFSLKEDTLQIKGNLKDQVTTTRLFYASLMDYDLTIQAYKTTSTNIYNLCTDGAYIPNTIPKALEEINADSFHCLDKTAIHTQLQSCFYNISTTKLNDTEKNFILIQFQYLDVVESLLNIEINSFDSFEDFEKFTNSIFETIMRVDIQFFFKEIFINYFFIINRYIAYYYNTTTANPSKELLMDVAFVWIEQVKQLIYQYKISFTDLLNQPSSDPK